MLGKQSSCYEERRLYTFDAEAGEPPGESVRPLTLERGRRDTPGRFGAPEGGTPAARRGLKAGMESDSAKLEATDLLGEDMPPLRAASSSNCKIAQC